MLSAFCTIYIFQLTCMCPDIIRLFFMFGQITHPITLYLYRFGKYPVPVHHLVQMEALLKKTLDFFAAAWRKLLFGWGAHCFLGWDNNLDFLKNNDLDHLKLKDNSFDFLKYNNLDFLKDSNLDFLKDNNWISWKTIICISSKTIIWISSKTTI